MADFLPTQPKAQRAFLIGVQTPDMPEGEADELLARLGALDDREQLIALLAQLAGAT